MLRRKSVRGFGAGMGVRGFGAGMGRNWGPSPRAYKDGSLGGYGPLMAYQDGSLGAGPGPLMSFKDGSLGMPLFIETGDGIEQIETPVTIHHGPMGEYFSPRPIGEYFSGMAGCRGCSGGLGQAPVAYPTPSGDAVSQAVTAAMATVAAVGSGAPTFDLSSPSAVKEVKNAMVVSPWVVGFAATVPEVMADVEDPVWTKMTVQIVGAWISGYVEFLYAQPTPPATPKATFMDALIREAFEGEFFVPNSLGLRNIYFGGTAGAIGVGISPAQAFPLLTTFLSEETASGSEGGVLPPAIEGQVPTKGNMLAIGIGVAALALVGMAVMGKKKG